MSEPELMADVPHVEVSRPFGVFDPWKLVRTLAAWIAGVRGRRAIHVPRMSNAWLEAHERESAQRSDW